MDCSKILAKCTETMDLSTIRELFKVLSQPGMISLAGGLPAPESFPVETIKKIADSVVDRYGAAVFQYGITEGFLPLREALVEVVKERGIEVSADDICTSTGAQTAIDAAAKVLIDTGDLVAVEAPTFLASMKTFKAYSPRFVSLPTDKDGVIPEEFDKLAKQNNLTFAYLIPTFQNPSGRTLSLERRKAIAEIAIDREVMILEDDPYFDLRYQGDHLPAIKSFAPDNVIYVGSLSKVLSPGMRLGYYIAPKEISSFMTSTRQGVDVHANSYTQAIAAEYIKGGHLKTQLPKILDIYRPRLQTMLRALGECMPEGFTWSKPEGGMYVWIEGPRGFDAPSVQKKAIERKVAFVPGMAFFPNPEEGRHTFRLNFTNVSEDKILQAVKVIGELCTDYYS